MSSPDDRVVTVTLNPAVDLTAGAKGVRLGAVNRVLWQQEDPGGKGVNVASFLAGFGVEVALTGLLGRDNEAPFRALMAAKGMDDRFVRVDGHSRTNVKLVDEEAGPDGVTDINFPGFEATERDLLALTAVLDELAGRHRWFVLSGSLPPGLPADTYRDLIGRLRGGGRQVALDTSGPALAAGLEAEPSVIKPNIHELADWLGRPIADAAAAVPAVRDLHAAGIETVIVSMGADGALFSDGREMVIATPPSVPVRSTVGAGDAMVAGFVAARLRGLPLAETARLATAFSLGALGQLGPRLPPPAEIEALGARVRVETMSC